MADLLRAPPPPPTPVAMLIGTAIIAGLSGYMIGIASSLGFLPIPFVPRAARPRGVEYYDDEEESGEEDIDDEAVLDHAPNWSNGLEADRRDGLRAGTAAAVLPRPGARSGGVVDGKKKEVVEKEQIVGKAAWEDSKEEYKMVLVVRTDLGMTKGKIAAQCGHATLACYKASKPQVLRRWEGSGQAKVALQVKGDDELEVLQATAISLGLTAEVIADAGRTQIASGSHTVLGIGPAPKSLIDQVTGKLKLL